ncbi:Dbl (DH) domain [Trinorchestia longiramus]|nr:Dbl (DH) domain [Trinorchestia longiramus]
MTEDPLKCVKKVKPVIPPKPKTYVRPNPPPKPPNLNKKTALSPKPPVPLKIQLNRDLEECDSGQCSSVSFDESISNDDNIDQPQRYHLRPNPLDVLPSRKNIVPSDDSQSESGHCNENESCETPTGNHLSLPVGRLTVNRTDDWRSDWRDSGALSNPHSLSSSTSSVCCESIREQGIDDNLEKLSDVDCSPRSNSASPIPMRDPSSPFPLNGCYAQSNNLETLPVTCDASNCVTSTNSEDNEEHSIPSSRSTKIYNLVKEMMTSEEVFFNVLKLLNVQFRQFVNEQGCIISNNNSRSGISRYGQHLSEEELNRILNYLPQLQNFSEGFLADLKQRLIDWDQHQKIADIIVTKGPFLKMHSSYIRDFEHQCSLLDEACSKDISFAKAVQAFESSDVCCKLSIKHYMLKPVQRIPQYRLLFQSYLDLLPTTSPDLEDARKALTILENVAAHANDTIKIEDKVSELLSLQRRIYRTADSSQPELLKPGREVLKQGELMKLSRRGMQPRYFALLSDVMLYASYSSGGNGMLKVNTELPLEGMAVSKPLADDFKAELTIRATQRSFTVQARDENERDEWLSAISSAIEANIARRSTFLSAKTSSYVPPPTGELGKQAPLWVPDYRVSMCQACTAEFSLTFRRHHCRACGKVVCERCSSNRAPLEFKANTPERVCDSCFESLFSALQCRIEQTESSSELNCPKKDATLQNLKKLNLHFKRGVRDSIRTKTVRKPDRLLEVSGNDMRSQMRGYLKKHGRRGWFVLKEKVLYQYAAPEDVCAVETLPVLGYTVHTSGAESAEPHFSLFHPKQEITFFAETPELAQKWITAMLEATVL